jgi:hypothetical protein
MVGNRSLKVALGKKRRGMIVKRTIDMTSMSPERNVFLRRE